MVATRGQEQSTRGIDDTNGAEEIHRKEPNVTAEEGLSAREESAVESDDEAPEEVTVATGEAQAKAAAAVKAKNLKKKALQADDRKAKRRKRDYDLKEQARTSKKRKISQVQDRDNDSSDASSLPDQPNSMTRDSVNNLAKSLLQSEGPLPAYLPDEIFAVEPESRPEILLTVQTKIPKSPEPGQEEKSKRKRLDVQLKPVKDVKRGNTRVRVLPQQSSALPPPVVQRSARIREQWLKDGMKRVKVPGYRQTGAKSFLRK